MAAVKSVNLFIKAFGAYNQNRYKDTPAIANRFTGLTEADIAFSNLTIDSGSGKVSASIASSTKNFKGDSQSWTRAALQNAKVTTFSALTLTGVTDQASFLQAIQHIETPGVYQVSVPELSNATALLVIYAAPASNSQADINTAILAVLQPAMLYTFDSAALVATVKGSTLQLSDNFISDAVYNAQTGQAVITVPATDYGDLGASA